MSFEIICSKEKYLRLSQDARDTVADIYDNYKGDYGFFDKGIKEQQERDRAVSQLLAISDLAKQKCVEMGDIKMEQKFSKREDDIIKIINK